MLAEDRADEADQAGHVVVSEDQHDAVEERVEMVGPDLHQTQVLVAEEGARRRVGFLVGDDLGPDQGAEIALPGIALLDNVDAALACQ